MTGGATPGYAELVWSDELAERYWRWQSHFPEHYFTGKFGGRIVRRLRPWLRGRRRVLDYGCGVGYLVPHLAALGIEVTATDHSAAAVDATNARNAAVQGFIGAVPVAELAASDRRFDAIVSIEVIEHLTDPQLAEFLATLRHLLAPDGIAIITTPNEENLRAAETFCPSCQHVFHRWQHLRRWSAAELAAAIDANGLRTIEAVTTDFSRLPQRDLLGEAKRVLKRLLGRPQHEPHLVAIARLRD
jgi:2-polyprenyl-3-methyl-5-hydroxy-6-metoxy-1,4-benzoquinol methylase